MTRNQENNLFRWMDEVEQHCLKADILPGIIICYNAEGDAAGFTLIVPPVLSDQDVASMLHQALLHHCTAKAVMP